MICVNVLVISGINQDLMGSSSPQESMTPLGKGFQPADSPPTCPRTHLLLPTDIADNGAGGRAGGWSQDSDYPLGEDLTHCSQQQGQSMESRKRNKALIRWGVG